MALLEDSIRGSVARVAGEVLGYSTTTREVDRNAGKIRRGSVADRAILQDSFTMKMLGDREILRKSYAREILESCTWKIL